MENLSYLFAGYTIFWLLLTVYFVVIHRQQKSIEQEIVALKEELKK
ncbi:CcmD family protein [candidate division KSB1 bacterium]|nr:CcmD family protein [candidate division KSB1 bacterium]